MFISKFISKAIGEKGRWRAYKARARQLPPPYRTAIEAIERYLMYFGPTDADSAASMFEDLATLFERAAAARGPIREIVGQDPAQFARTFAEKYSEGGYVPAGARKRLTHTIETIEREQENR